MARHLETFESYTAKPGRNERILLLLTFAVIALVGAAWLLASLVR